MAFNLHQTPRRDPNNFPRRPRRVLHRLLFFFFLASQSNEQRTCLFFFFSLCDSVVRLSIVYSLSCLSLSLSLFHSHSVILPQRARTNVTRIRNLQFRKRDAPLCECDTNSRDLSFFSPVCISFSLSLFLSHTHIHTLSFSLLFTTNHANFFIPLEMRFFYFVSWFSFVLLSVEAIYYFKRHCSYDIDRLLWKKRSPDFSAISFSLISLAVSHSRPHSRIATLFVIWTCRTWRQVLSFISAFRHTSPQRALSLSHNTFALIRRARDVRFINSLHVWPA